MFAIYVKNKGQYFMKDHKKVIVFDDPHMAGAFADAFFNFAMTQAMQFATQGDIGIIGDVMSTMQQVNIEELPEKIEFEIINFNDLKNH